MNKKKFLFVSATAVVALFLVLSCLSIFHSSTFDPQPVFLTQAFQSEIMLNEAKLPLRPGTNKTFVWAREDHQKTPYSLVQIHGFSATRREIAPLPERLAKDFGMNLFMTRLTGHGLGAEGMLSITAPLLLRDAEEALAVGERMGEKVIVLGTSTGASLALALAEKNPNRVAAFVFLSPNFRPYRRDSLLLKGPVGKLIAKYAVKTHTWKAPSPDVEKYWTTSYSTLALHEMMDLLSWVNRFDLSKFKIPLLVFYTETDKVVDVALMKTKFALYGGPKKMVAVDAHHVIAGDIMAPQSTESVLRTTEQFLKEQLPGCCQ
jgi:esterase/lipase